MRQSEYTQYYERRGNVKYPVRGKLYMRHRGRAIYVRNGILIDGFTGMAIPRQMGKKGKILDKTLITEFLDSIWDKLVSDAKTLRKTQWQSWEGGVYRINGKFVPQDTSARSIPY